jgi:hypothetical protein
MPKPLSPEDATMLRLLKTPPKPFTPKAKPKVSPLSPATKADHAKFKRSDKVAFKPAPKKS